MAMQPYQSSGGDQPSPGPHDVVGRVGDVSFTPTTIHLPGGRTMPMAGSVWTVRDNTMRSEQTPQWALICAILGFFLVCFLSLFLLLVKETRVSGYLDVEVRSGNDFHLTQIPAYNIMAISDAHRQVDYARSLSTWAQQQ